MSNRVFCIDTSQDIKRTHRCHHQTLEERWIEPATVQSFTRQAAKPLQHGRSLEAVVNDRVLAQCCPHLVPVTSLRHQRSRLRHSATFENKWRICKLETATYDKSCGLLQDRIGRCQNFYAWVSQTNTSAWHSNNFTQGHRVLTLLTLLLKYR